jgi:hypothetical protein
MKSTLKKWRSGEANSRLKKSTVGYWRLFGLFIQKAKHGCSQLQWYTWMEPSKIFWQ